MLYIAHMLHVFCIQCHTVVPSRLIAMSSSLWSSVRTFGLGNILPSTCSEAPRKIKQLNHAPGDPLFWQTSWSVRESFKLGMHFDEFCVKFCTRVQQPERCAALRSFWAVAKQVVAVARVAKVCKTNRCIEKHPIHGHGHRSGTNLCFGFDFGMKDPVSLIPVDQNYLHIAILEGIEYRMKSCPSGNWIQILKLQDTGVLLDIWYSILQRTAATRVHLT